MWRMMRNVSWSCTERAAAVGTVLIAVIISTAGCSGPTTVNIPPMAGDVAFHDPNDSTVVRVEAISIERIVSDYPTQGPYAVKLPDGTNADSYKTVLMGLPEGATTEEASGGDLPTYEAAQIQIHGTTADVDIIRPLPAGARQLVRVEMAIDIDGWYVSRVRPWDVDVLEQLRIIRGDVEPKRQRPAETYPQEGAGGGSTLGADDVPPSNGE